MEWGYYAELHPDELDALKASPSLVYVPWGALEWHGPHLPLGVDGLIAQAIAAQVAQHTGGVVLPTTWWPITPLPHPQSLPAHSETLLALWHDIFQSLAQSKWRTVVVLSGHYSHGHELALMNAAEHAMQKLGLLVLALPPFALIDDTMLDHAGLWETSLMLALHPALVRLEALGTAPSLTLRESGVLGEDPRATASASVGKQAIAMAVERLSSVIKTLMETQDAASLHAFYEKRRIRFRAFVENYDQGSLEQANLDWWRDIFMKQNP